MASAAGGQELQRRVLDLALEADPLPLAFPVLAAALLEDSADLSEALALARAVLDLTLAGLLSGDGLRVRPTRAALVFARLERTG